MLNTSAQKRWLTSDLQYRASGATGARAHCCSLCLLFLKQRNLTVWIFYNETFWWSDLQDTCFGVSVFALRHLHAGKYSNECLAVVWEAPFWWKPDSLSAVHVQTGTPVKHSPSCQVQTTNCVYLLELSETRPQQQWAGTFLSPCTMHMCQRFVVQAAHVFSFSDGDDASRVF